MRAYKIPAKLKKQETYITVDGKPHQLKEFCRDRENDIALFRLPNGLRLPSFPDPIGNSMSFTSEISLISCAIP